MIAETIDQTFIEEETRPKESNADDKAHVISPSMNAVAWMRFGCDIIGGTKGVHELIKSAAKSNVELVALCGHHWVPKGEAPTDIDDVCEPCMAIVQSWIGEDE